MLRHLPLIMLLTALASPGCEAPGLSVGNVGEPRVAAELVALNPAHGDIERFAADPLWADFDVHPIGLAVAVLDPDGHEVALRGSWATQTRYIATPLSPLAAAAEHRFRVRWTDDGVPREEVASFVTGSRLLDTLLDGAPRARFDVDFADSTILSPAVGDAVLNAAGLVLLHEVKAEREGRLVTLDAFAALGSHDGSQELCAPTFRLARSAETQWTSPYFAHGPMDVPAFIQLPFVGRVPIVLYDLRIAGMFVADPVTGEVERMEDISFSATIDVRDAGLGDACGQLALLFPGIVCEPCSTDAAVQCLNFQGIDGVAPRSKGARVAERFEADIEADERCE